MDDIIMYAVIILVAVAVIGVILLFRSSKRDTMLMPDERLRRAGDSSVEYEWSSRSKVFSKVVLVLALIVAGVFFYVFFSEDVDSVLSNVPQIGLFILGLVLSFFAGAMKTYTYQITSMGLYRFDAKRGGEKQLMFTWHNLSWIKPDNDGFRYYLKSSPTANLSALALTSGKIYCGDHAMVVNAILMSRGVAITPPNQSGN